jgi:quinoprotein glucose dehydrogenase
VIGPPWSSLVAYDLNSGTIKWKVPLGQDATAAAQGAANTGVFMAEHHGIITTSTGLLFVATTDGKVRAHDADTGKVLWTGDLPTGSEGMPAMYQVNGRQFLVVPASSGINSGGGHGGRSSAQAAAGQTTPGQITPGRTKSYVAFALPDKANK